MVTTIAIPDTATGNTMAATSTAAVQPAIAVDDQQRGCGCGGGKMKRHNVYIIDDYIWLIVALLFIVLLWKKIKAA